VLQQDRYACTAACLQLTFFVRFADSGTLVPLSTHPCLPDDVATGVGGTSFCAAIRVSADGAFVFCSNRGHDSICTFCTLPDGGLEFVAHSSTLGHIPRDFTLVGGIAIVANQVLACIARMGVAPRSTTPRPQIVQLAPWSHPQFR